MTASLLERPVTVEVSGLRHRLPGGRPLFDDLELSVRAGESLVLLDGGQQGGPCQGGLLIIRKNASSRRVSMSPNAAASQNAVEPPLPRMIS